MPTPDRAPRNHGVFKNLAKNIRELFYPSLPKQRARVVPFNNTRNKNKNKNKNNTNKNNTNKNKNKNK